MSVFLRAGHPAIARSGKWSHAEVLACCECACGTQDLLGTQAHPDRNIEGSVLADLGCHPYIPPKHTEDVLEGVHSHLGTEGCAGPQQPGRSRELSHGRPPGRSGRVRKSIHGLTLSLKPSTKSSPISLLCSVPDSFGPQSICPQSCLSHRPHPEWPESVFSAYLCTPGAGDSLFLSIM